MNFAKEEQKKVNSFYIKSNSINDFNKKLFRLKRKRDHW